MVLTFHERNDKVDSQQYLANSLTDSQRRRKPASVALDDLNQEGSRRLELPRRKRPSFPWEPQPTGKPSHPQIPQPLKSVHMSSWKQRKSSVYSHPPSVWYEATQPQENPSQTLDGDSSPPETINNITFTEEKRNKMIRANSTPLCVSQQSLCLPKHGTLGKKSMSYYCK